MKEEATETVEKLLEIIEFRLVAREPVLISGYGKRLVKDKTTRRGRYPQTGEAVILNSSGHDVPVFDCVEEGRE